MRFNEAGSQRRLARDVVAALDVAGLDTGLTGWKEVEDMADADLAPVERPLCALDVPPGDTPRTAVRWIREALR